MSRWALLAQTYTPGTVIDQATQNGSTGPYPPSSNLGQAMPTIAPKTPIIAVVVVIAVLLLLEHRRLRLSRK